MKTLSLNKNKTLSISEAADKWWNSRNVFFSTIAEENFTNKEVILVHLILMELLACIAFIEAYPVVSIIAMGVSGACVKFLNNDGNNNNITN